jgi:GT2 family glycosyltransferase
MIESTKNVEALVSTKTISSVQVSVIIVVWNAKKYVIECLQSLDKFKGDVCLEVICVDNASTDGTPDLIEKEFPNVRLIRNSENLGFAKANNIGIALATGDYVALVNSDVTFTQECFDPMIKYMSEHTDVGILGPKMLAADGHVARSTMRFPTVWNTFCRALALDVTFKSSKLFSGQLMFDFSHASTADVEVLAGWFWFVRRLALNRVGPLDAQFFMYGEDVDWCFRFHQAGERVVFFADAEAIHFGGASSLSAPIRFTVEKERANLQLFRKHYGFFSRLGLFLTRFLYYFIRAFGFGFLCLFKGSRKEDNLLKCKRSFACLQWIVRAGA